MSGAPSCKGGLQRTTDPYDWVPENGSTMQDSAWLSGMHPTSHNPNHTVTLEAGGFGLIRRFAKLRAADNGTGRAATAAGRRGLASHF